MKARNLLSLIVLLLLNSTVVNAQKDTTLTLGGVYLSIDDFKSGKLTYDIDCNKEKQKIRLYDFFAKPYFDVWYKGEKIRLMKNQVFGYKNCLDKTFRFYENMDFQVVEIGGICIYSQEQMVLADKAGKVGISYFMSANPGGPIKVLNTNNLKDAFPENKVFQKMVDTKINSVNIADYDSLQKTYKINLLLKESLKK